MSATSQSLKLIEPELFEYFSLEGDGAPTPGDAFEETRYAPEVYIEERLGWKPWSGDFELPGQLEVLDAYVLALRQQHEREAYEAGEVTEAGLRYWRPGQVIKNRIRVEAGHTVGKTKLASGIVNHFFDHFAPSVGYCFAPSWEQIHDLLFKEIKADRRGKGLPGRILDLSLIVADNHFVKGKATNNSGGQGTERAQGQHGKYLIFVLDEAEGVDDYVWNAVDSMTSGGISVVLMLANPRTRTSKFHKAGGWSNVASFRISCLHHPNVVEGREVVPGAVKRQYVEEMIEKHCEVAQAHNPDDHTFELPYPVTAGGVTHPPGTVFLPDAEFMFRVKGEAPANTSDKTLIPVGRYEAATRRDPAGREPHKARLGIDCARWGHDKGTLYVCHDGRAWRAAQLPQLDSVEYYQAAKAECLRLARKGVTDLRVRVDGGGGFGGGVVDLLKRDAELRELFEVFQVLEVNFNGTPADEKAYADLITELTAAAGQALLALAVVKPPEELAADLCEREYEWVIKGGLSVKKLEPKDKFKKRQTPQRSPDDGDGFVLAAAPDHLFASQRTYGALGLGAAKGWGF